MSTMESAAQMSLATAISRVTGFLRIAVLASALGLLRVADAYNLANVMPNMIYELLMGGILSSLFIPVFIEHFMNDRQEAWNIASIVVNIAALSLTVCAIFGLIFAYPLVRILTALEPGHVAAVSQTVFFFRFFIPQIVFYGVGAVFTGVLNSHKRFMLPAIAPIINNLTVIITVLIAFMPVYPRDPNAATINLAVGTTLGVVMMAAVQVPAIMRLGWRYRFSFDVKNPAIIKLGKLAVPVVGYVACNMTGLAVTYNLAFSKSGGITAYQYAWNFFQLPYGIFAVSISTALFPALSEHVSNNELGRFKEQVIFGLRTTAFIIIPAAALILVLSPQIIRLLLQHGRFDAAATAMTSPVLSCFAIGLFSFSSYMFLTRTYYALQDTKTPMIVNALGVPLNIALNLIFIRFFGIAGLALGHALTYSGTFAAMLVLLRRKVGQMAMKSLLLSVSRTILCSVPAAGAAFIVAKMREPATDIPGQCMQLGLALTAALVLYAGLSALLKAEELFNVTRIWRNKAS